MGKSFLRNSRHTAAIAATAFAIMVGLVTGSVTLTSCATEEKNSTASEVLNYYNIDAVYKYHNELSDALSDSAQALSSENEKLLDSSLKELDVLCDELTVTADIPDSMVAYHDKMVEAADAVKQYTSAIRDNNFDAAAEKIKVVQKKIEEAKDLLPDTTA